jgi:hypothetical protein
MMNAVDDGLYKLKPTKGADIVEDWESALADIDHPVGQGISRNLAAFCKWRGKDRARQQAYTVHRLPAGRSDDQDFEAERQSG